MGKNNTDFFDMHNKDSGLLRLYLFNFTKKEAVTYIIWTLRRRYTQPISPI